MFESAPPSESWTADTTIGLETLRELNLQRGVLHERERGSKRENEREGEKNPLKQTEGKRQRLRERDRTTERQR